MVLPSKKNYNVTYEVENYLFQSTNIDVAKGSNYYESHDVIQLQPLVVGSKIILKNLFFDFLMIARYVRTTDENLAQANYY
jgi:hypothetical protein